MHKNPSHHIGIVPCDSCLRDPTYRTLFSAEFQGSHLSAGVGIEKKCAEHRSSHGTEVSFGLMAMLNRPDVVTFKGDISFNYTNDVLKVFAS